MCNNMGKWTVTREGKVFPAVTLPEWCNDTVAQQSRKAQLNYRCGRGGSQVTSAGQCQHCLLQNIPPLGNPFNTETAQEPLKQIRQDLGFSFLPDKTVNLRASWAIMFTKPFSRESKVLPSSIRYLDSQARQYCSLECNMLLHGTVKLPGKDGIAKMEFMLGENTMADSWQEEPNKGSEPAGHWNILAMLLMTDQHWRAEQSCHLN